MLRIDWYLNTNVIQDDNPTWTMQQVYLLLTSFVKQSSVIFLCKLLFKDRARNWKVVYSSNASPTQAQTTDVANNQKRIERTVTLTDQTTAILQTYTGDINLNCLVVFNPSVAQLASALFSETNIFVHGEKTRQLIIC